jgi:hypothetical protein
MFKIKTKLNYFLVFLLVIFLGVNINHITCKNEFHESFKNLDKISKLREKCGLPQDYSETGHCFADGTHQTCCMLGPEAREYADNSGNPIGAASIRAFEAKNGRAPNADELTHGVLVLDQKYAQRMQKSFQMMEHI